MTTMYLSPATLIAQYLTNVGIVAQNAQLFTYLGGTVSTPLTTFTDSTGLVSNPNPMTLSAAGRPQSVSGAPTEFWHPSGITLTLYVYDANSNLLVYLPNLPAINDPAGAQGLQTLLASPLAGNGADLVANAMKSYALVANVQASPVPTLVSGQTLIIGVEGSASANDGLGGFFLWNSASTAADDGGVTTITPGGASPPATGRYLRLLVSSVQSFTATLTGMTTTVTGTVKYVKTNDLVTLWCDSAITGISNSTAMTLTGLPAAITPANQRNVPCAEVGNAGAFYWAEALVANTGIITFLGIEAFAGSPSLVGSNPGLFVNSGTKGLGQGWSITYPLG